MFEQPPPLPPLMLRVLLAAALSNVNKQEYTVYKTIPASPLHKSAKLMSISNNTYQVRNNK
jgi:hypothetical protein